MFPRRIPGRPPGGVMLRARPPGLRRLFTTTVPARSSEADPMASEPAPVARTGETTTQTTQTTDETTAQTTPTTDETTTPTTDAPEPDREHALQLRFPEIPRSSPVSVLRRSIFPVRGGGRHSPRYTLPCSEPVPAYVADKGIKRALWALRGRAPGAPTVDVPNSIYSFGEGGPSTMSAASAVEMALQLTEVTITALENAAMFMTPVADDWRAQRAGLVVARWEAGQDELERLLAAIWAAPEGERAALIAAAAMQAHVVHKLAVHAVAVQLMKRVGVGYLRPRSAFLTRANHARLANTMAALAVVDTPGLPSPRRLKFALAKTAARLVEREIRDARETVVAALAHEEPEPRPPLPQPIPAWRERLFAMLEDICDAVANGNPDRTVWFHHPKHQTVEFECSVGDAARLMQTKYLPLLVREVGQPLPRGPSLNKLEYTLLANLLELTTNGSRDSVRHYTSLASPDFHRRASVKGFVGKRLAELPDDSAVRPMLLPALAYHGVFAPERLVALNTELIVKAPPPPEEPDEADTVPFYRYGHGARPQLVPRVDALERTLGGTSYVIEGLRLKAQQLEARLQHQAPPWAPHRFTYSQQREFSTSARRSLSVPDDAADGAYTFVNGKRRFTPKTGGIRARMEAQEREYAREMAHALVASGSDVLEGGSDPLATGRSGDDPEDGTSYEAFDIARNDPGELTNFKGMTPLVRGDLCELRFATGGAAMALYLRPTPGGQTAQFLTATGTVVPFFPSRVTFVVPRFVAAAAIDDFLRYFDSISQFHAARGAEHDDAALTSRAVTAPLLWPVKQFVLAAGAIHTAAHAAFDALYAELAHDTEPTWVALADVAARVFPGATPPSDAQLYATHRALMGDGLRYTGDRGFHRYTQKFLVRSRKDLGMIDAVTAWLRKILNAPGGSTAAKSTKLPPSGRSLLEEAVAHPEFAGPLKAFIAKARTLIDASRRLRASTDTLTRVPRPDLAWTPADTLFIAYCKARLLNYGLQSTPLEGLVPYILRQTARYDVAKLDAAATFDFLVDIGVFAPWENTMLQQPSQGLPGCGTSAAADAEQQQFDAVADKALADLGLVDALAGIRKDWGDMKVFTVDDAAAHEIDDGISVERVSDTETRVHVHIANPTAFLPPDHWISQAAQRRGVTRYLQPYTFPMFPSPIGRELSVAPGNPVLTFSAILDAASGDVKSFAITPGVVHNVTAVTYSQLDAILGIPAGATTHLAVGAAPTTPAAATPPQLSAEDIAALKLLRDTAHTLIHRRVRDGMIQLAQSTHSAAVHFPPPAPPSHAHLTSPHPVLWRSFPALSFSVTPARHASPPSTLLVAEYMLLAGSIAAQYSTQHSLPQPFRIVEPNPDRPDVVQYYNEKILPARNEFGDPGASSEDLGFFLLVGRAAIRTEAGEQMLLGLPGGYVKATSPLRRFADCVVHWNLGAHLLAEAERKEGKAGVKEEAESTESSTESPESAGSAESSTSPAPTASTAPPDSTALTLPFPAPTLAALLPALDMTEKLSRHASSETERLWPAALILRLQQLDQLHQLPPLTFTVTEAKRWPQPAMGWVPELAVVGKLVLGAEAAAAVAAEAAEAGGACEAGDAAGDAVGAAGEGEKGEKGEGVQGEGQGKVTKGAQAVMTTRGERWEVLGVDRVSLVERVVFFRAGRRLRSAAEVEGGVVAGF